MLIEVCGEIYHFKCMNITGGKCYLKARDLSRETSENSLKISMRNLGIKQVSTDSLDTVEVRYKNNVSFNETNLYWAGQINYLKSSSNLVNNFL